MSEAPFAAKRHELPAMGKQPSLVAEPLPASLAIPLGEAFAAIDPWASYPYPAAGLAQYLGATELGAPRFALYCAGNLAGAMGLRLNWLRGPYLQFLGVLPAHQRRGIGERVLVWIEDQARGANERNLWVAASDFNCGAIRFYERHGFVVVAQLADLVREGRTEVLLRKRL